MKAFALWGEMENSDWENKPVWIHGDLSIGNIIIDENKKLCAVIDFGGLGVGDPSCDLVMAWTFFKNKSRQIFKEHLNLDKNTWTRAKGWALWKATYELCNIENEEKAQRVEFPGERILPDASANAALSRNTIEAEKQKNIIQEVLNDE